MSLFGIIGDIFGGAKQLHAEGGWFGQILCDSFVSRTFIGGELPPDLGATQFR